MLSLDKREGDGTAATAKLVNVHRPIEVRQVPTGSNRKEDGPRNGGNKVGLRRIY